MVRRRVRGLDLFVEVVGQGPPLLLMHGGPGADHWTMQPFRQLSERFTLVFYDHRCNGRSTGAPVESMTFDNLTADADALRETLGFERWTVLGHSFGGHVALEYALRYPDQVSQLVLLDTGADSRWSRENAPRLVAERGYGTEQAELVRRWFRGEFEPRQMARILMRLGPIYNPHTNLLGSARMLWHGWRTKLRPEPLIFAGRVLLDGWSVVDRLADITAPTLVIAGRDDFVFPPESQQELASGIPGARLVLIDRAGHNPHDERTDEVMDAIRDFSGPAASPGAAPARV
jgi:pimeloyl-ACP methyl ester carboxylesterase